MVHELVRSDVEVEADQACEAFLYHRHLPNPRLELHENDSAEFQNYLKLLQVV